MIETLMAKGMSKTQALAFEWQFKYPGGFKAALWECIKRADEDSLEKLALAFPDEVMAYIYYTRTPGWWPQTLEKARELGLIEEGVS